jgi:hypothetical protein
MSTSPNDRSALGFDIKRPEEVYNAYHQKFIHEFTFNLGHQYLREESAPQNPLYNVVDSLSSAPSSAVISRPEESKSPQNPLSNVEDSFHPTSLSSAPSSAVISRPKESKSPQKTPALQKTMSEPYNPYACLENLGDDAGPSPSNQPIKYAHSRTCSNYSLDSSSEHGSSSDEDYFDEDYSDEDPGSSDLNISCVSAISTSNLNPDYEISKENNRRIHIKDIKDRFNIQDPKYKELQTVFRHGRLFINETYAYFKAIGVGYLDHLCRTSTHSNALNQFISNLESKSGYYKLSIQSEDNRNLLIYMLNQLAAERSIDSLDDYYSHTEFMEAYINELQNITYNSMVKMKVKQNILESFEENELEPKDVLKYIGNALKVLIFTHSTHDTQPKKFNFKDYSFVMNLIVSSRFKACLLYYNYLNGEDTRVPTNKNKYKCKDCGLLPHETYFFKVNGDTCQRCHFDRDNKQTRQGQGRARPSTPQQEEKKTKFNLPTKEEQSQGPTHECDGCRDTVPIKLLMKYCSNPHILCEKCVIISNKRVKCIICNPQPTRPESKRQEPTRGEPTNRPNQFKPQTFQKLCMLCKCEKATKFLKCKHLFCAQCLKEHIDNQILNTPLSVHIQAGLVSITCPISTCGKFISSNIFYPMITQSTKKTYDSIISILPKENCSKCNAPKLLPHLIDLQCHKFCMHCMIEYFDDKLNRGKVNFKCIRGCYHDFKVFELRKLMKPNQYSKYQKIKSGNKSRDQVQECPGCDKKFFNIQTYQKFKCNECDSKFCGDCGKVYKIRGKYREGEHRPGCSFFS